MIITKAKSKPAYPELRGSLAGIKFPAIADFKLDGELQYVVVDKTGEGFCVNKYGSIKSDFPALNVFRSAHRDTVLVAELYFGAGSGGTFYDMQKCKDKDTLNLYAFDMLQLDGQDLRGEPLITRLEHLVPFLQSLKLPNPNLKVVGTQKEAQEYFEYATKSPYAMEGIVVKNFDEVWTTGPCTWCKIKNKDQNDYEVIYLDNTKERIEVKVPRASNSVAGSVIGGSVRVGVKAPNRYKKHIKIGDMVTIEHQGVLASGSLRHPVLIPKKGW